MLPLLATLLAANCTCGSCPAGLLCDNGTLAPCPPWTWSDEGTAECLPCAECDNTTVVAAPCAPGRDTVCRRCTEGFVVVNGSCEVEGPYVSERYAVAVFLTLVLELLICTAWWRWWVVHRQYKAVPAPDRP